LSALPFGTGFKGVKRPFFRQNATILRNVSKFRLVEIGKLPKMANYTKKS
jgi:hypothetical protein